MLAVQLELENCIEELLEARDNSLLESVQTKELWEEGYYVGQTAAYDEAIERCERVMATIAGFHTET